MPRLLAPLLAFALVACTKSYVSGPLDLARAEKGDVFVEAIDLGGDRTLLRGAIVVDGPPYRVLNLYRDAENIPTWHPAFVSVRVLGRDGDTLDAELTLRPVLGRQLSPMHALLRADDARGEISMTGFENDWAASFQTVIKAEKLDPDGHRTLISGYSVLVPKIWGASLARGASEERLAEALVNARSAVRLPRYAEPPPVAPVARKGKVVVPAFAATGLKEDTVRLLNRVFAEERMRTAPWNVVTEDEAAAILVHARQRQLLGCDDETCAPDVARTLDAEHLVAGRAGMVGGKYLVTLSLLRFPEGTVENRLSVEADDEGALAERLRGAADRLAKR